LVAIIAGVVLLASGLIRRQFPLWVAIIPLACGLTILQQVIPDLTRIHSEFTDVMTATFSAGIGIWLVIVAGSVAILGAAITFIPRPSNYQLMA
jgi:hypothetical protein